MRTWGQWLFQPSSERVIQATRASIRPDRCRRHSTHRYHTSSVLVRLLTDLWVLFAWYVVVVPIITVRPIKSLRTSCPDPIIYLVTVQCILVISNLDPSSIHIAYHAIMMWSFKFHHSWLDRYTMQVPESYKLDCGRVVVFICLDIVKCF